jgi:cytochrome c oxidase subunit 2
MILLKYLTIPLLMLSSSAFANNGNKPVESLGKNLYFSCSSCHGKLGEGSAALHAPRLAGQNQKYLVEQITAFRDKRRGENSHDKYGQQMALMAANLKDDAAIDLVVQYIATLPKPTNAPELKNSKLYQQCIACHGISGEGVDAMSSPRIAGLNSLYLETQLLNFKKGIRVAPNTSFGQQMKTLVDKLTIEELKKLSELIGDNNQSSKSSK